MIRRNIAALACAAAIVGFVATSAVAGGHVDIVANPLPKQIEAGKSVPVSFTIAWPGGEPVQDAKPVVRMKSGRRTVEARAHETKVRGTYLANVVVPASGEWSAMVDAKICGNTCTLNSVTAYAANGKKERVATR